MYMGEGSANGQLDGSVTYFQTQFQTGSAWAYTQEYMELSGVLLYLSDINNYEQHSVQENVLQNWWTNMV